MGGHAEPGGGFGVDLADLGVIGEAEVVIEAPYNFLLSAEDHSAADLSFQFWKCEVTVCSFPMLTDRAVVFD
jgi:hypothetical protein